MAVSVGDIVINPDGSMYVHDTIGVNTPVHIDSAGRMYIDNKGTLRYVEVKPDGSMFVPGFEAPVLPRYGDPTILNRFTGGVASNVETVYLQPDRWHIIFLAGSGGSGGGGGGLASSSAASISTGGGGGLGGLASSIVVGPPGPTGPQGPVRIAAGGGGGGAGGKGNNYDGSNVTQNGGNGGQGGSSSGSIPPVGTIIPFAGTNGIVGIGDYNPPTMYGYAAVFIGGTGTQSSSPSGKIAYGQTLVEAPAEAGWPGDTTLAASNSFAYIELINNSNVRAPQITDSIPKSANLPAWVQDYVTVGYIDDDIVDSGYVGVGGVGGSGRGSGYNSSFAGSAGGNGGYLAFYIYPYEELLCYIYVANVELTNARGGGASAGVAQAGGNGASGNPGYCFIGRYDQLTPFVPRFVAVAQHITTGYSLNGINWTAAFLPETAWSWAAVAYGNGKFIAVSGDAMHDNFAYSTDGGVHWEPGNQPIDYGYIAVAYGNGKFVAVPYNYATAVYSTDGVHWTPTSLPAALPWYWIAYGAGKFVTVATGLVAAYSIDGISWTTTAMPSISNWRVVAYGDNKFVAVSTGSSAAAYSTDGMYWTATTLPISANWVAVAYGNGRFVAIAGSAIGTTVTAYSTNGMYWTAATLPSALNWYAITYGNGKFVAVARNSITAAYSTDGINWTTVTLASNSDWRGIAYGDGT